MAKKVKEVEAEEEVEVDPAEAKRLRKAAKIAAAERAAAAAVAEVEDWEPVKKKKSKKEAAAEVEEEDKPVKKNKKVIAEEAAEPTDKELAEAKAARKAARKAAKAASAAAEAGPEEEPEEAPKVKKNKKKAKDEEEEEVSEPVQKKAKKADEAAVNGEEPPIYRLFVGGVPYTVQEEQLKKDFSECGEVADIKLLMDRESGESRGIAFITMADKKGCDAALAYHGQEYAGRTLNVSMATSTGGVGTNGKGGKGKGKDGKAKGKGKSKAPQEKPAGCTSVVVKGLSYEVTQEDLQECFKACGQGPTNIKVLTDRDTGKSRGLAFVDFDDTNAVDLAMKLTETNLKGRSFFMDYSTPRDF